MMMYLQANFLNTAFSLRTISYEVTQVSHSPGSMVSRINAAYKYLTEHTDGFLALY